MRRSGAERARDARRGAQLCASEVCVFGERGGLIQGRDAIEDRRRPARGARSARFRRDSRSRGARRGRGLSPIGRGDASRAASGGVRFARRRTVGGCGFDRAAHGVETPQERVLGLLREFPGGDALLQRLRAHGRARAARLDARGSAPDAERARGGAAERAPVPQRRRSDGARARVDGNAPPAGNGRGRGARPRRGGRGVREHTRRCARVSRARPKRRAEQGVPETRVATGGIKPRERETTDGTEDLRRGTFARSAACVTRCAAHAGVVDIALVRGAARAPAMVNHRGLLQPLLAFLPLAFGSALALTLARARAGSPVAASRATRGSLPALSLLPRGACRGGRSAPSQRSSSGGGGARIDARAASSRSAPPPAWSPA